MTSDHRALYSLFLDCFTPDELRRFLRDLDGGERIVNSLPGHSVSMATLAYEAVDLLRRHGLVNAALFGELIAARPLHEQPIREIAGRSGVAIAATPRGGPIASPIGRDRADSTKILLLASNATTSALRLDIEAREIRNVIEAATRRDRFEYVTRQAVRVDDLIPCFTNVEADIVHFAGHGADESGLVFANNLDEPALVRPDALRRLFGVINRDARERGIGREIRCVVLNACLSVPQAEAIVTEVDCVIGMSKNIQDQAAIGFATQFYAALLSGRPVDSAFELARTGNAMNERGHDDVPRLFEREAGVASRTVFGA